MPKAAAYLSDPRDGKCHSYERGVCMKGTKCKFEHIGDIPQQKRLDVCADFQWQTGCQRAASCRWLHLSIDEEDLYIKDKIMPVHGGDPHKVQHLRVAVAQRMPPAQTRATPWSPVCRDFQKHGRGCDRGYDCQYRHLTQSDVEMEKSITKQVLRQLEDGEPIDDHNQIDSRMRGGGGQQLMMGGSGGSQISAMAGDKRRRRPTSSGDGDDDDPASTEVVMSLRKKITEQKKEILELRDQMDTMYDQSIEYKKEIRKLKEERDGV